MDLRNSTVLITGGTSGFGLQFVEQFCARGSTVIVTGRDIEKLEQTKRLFPRIHTFQSDVSKADDIRELHSAVMALFPNLNILINNAGEMRKIVLHDHYDITDINREVDINLTGPIRMIQQFLPHLKSQRSAAIVNVTSGIALGPFPLAPVYGASKAGLRSFTKSLRVQLQHTSVKVFELVAPGSPTPLNEKFKGVDGFNPNMLMAPEKIIEECINGIEKDRYEIYPGLLKVFRYLMQFAPNLMLSQASKIGASLYSKK